MLEAEYAGVLGIRRGLLGDRHHDTADTRRNLTEVRALRMDSPPGTAG